MVFHDRPVYQEEHAAQLIMARSLHSPHEGRIHLRRSVDLLFAFPLQSDGGPYICGNLERHPLNPNLIAIIGGKGAGKSALAELIAFAGGSEFFKNPKEHDEVR